jgi:hypothetical protein
MIWNVARVNPLISARRFLVRGAGKRSRGIPYAGSIEAYRRQ